MDSSTHLLAAAEKILGMDWGHFMTTVGWTGNAVFFSRFLVQWHATEKRRQVTIPAMFWWLSLVGTLLLLVYAVHVDRGWVFIFAYAFSWIPYIRNLVIHYRHLNAEKTCPGCGEKSSPRANYCAACGVKLPAAQV